jgi:uncharacterized protein with ParB-like and HNH nuclease domain
MSKGNFDVIRATIGDVYIKPKSKFKIPRFQRQYTWEEKQIEEFWDTIISTSPVFIGTVIFDTRENEDNNENPIEIIDGQQRYLTIQIFGSVVRNIIRAEGEKSKDPKYIQKSNGINTRIIGAPDDDDNEKFYNYLIPGDSIKDFFEEYIQKNPPEKITEDLKVSKNSEEERVKKAYLKFHSLITEEIKNLNFEEKYKWLKNLIDHKLSKHFFVKIEIEDEGLAYEIFETVNAKGVDLSVADLIKNQIFKNVVGSDEKHLDSAKEKWSLILESLDSIEFSLKVFLSYYWTSKYEYVSDKKLYSAIREKFKSNKKYWETFLNELKNNAEYLKLIVSGSLEDIESHFGNDKGEALKVYNSLRVLRSTKAKTWIILYMSLFRNLDATGNKKPNIPLSLSKRWEIIQKFTFLYFQILSLPGNWYFKLVSNVSKKIEQYALDKKVKKDYVELFKNELFIEFKTKLTSYETFEEGFKTIQYKDDQKSRIIIRYVLNELENKIGGNTDEGYDENKVSIEHILPRDPKKWKVSKTLIKPYVNTLGNLTLIGKKLNGELGNEKIDDKIKIIEANNSSLSLVKELIIKVNSKEWDFEKISSDKDFEPIEKRLEYYSKKGHQIWNDDLKTKMGF